MLRIGLFALAALAAACTTPDGAAAAAGGHDCFRAASVSGFSVIDEHNVEVRVGANRRYILHTDWSTHNLDFSQAIAIRSTTGSICTGNGLGVELAGGHPVTTYPIHAITRAPDPAPASPQS